MCPVPSTLWVVLRHRTKKQIIIASCFFAFWIVLIALVVASRRAASPLPTPTPRLAQPLVVRSAKVIATGPGTGDIVGLLENPNADAGALRVKYRFAIRHPSGEPSAVDGETFILPGKQKYVAAFTTLVDPTSAVDLTVEQPDWTFVGPGFYEPSLVLVDRSQRLVPGPVPTYEVRGRIVNRSDVDYLRVEVTTVGFDVSGQVVGISTTFLGSLRALEQRDFLAQWFLPPGAAVADVRVFPDVNVFRADAVQQREGSTDLRDVPRGGVIAPTP